MNDIQQVLHYHSLKLSQALQSIKALEARVAQLEADNAALKAEPKPLTINREFMIVGD